MAPLMVIETVSSMGANCVPLPMTPPSVTELVPAGIVCEAVNPLNVTAIGCTTMLPIESNCWLPTQNRAGADRRPHRGRRAQDVQARTRALVQRAERAVQHLAALRSRDAARAGSRVGRTDRPVHIRSAGQRRVQRNIVRDCRRAVAHRDREPDRAPRRDCRRVRRRRHRHHRSKIRGEGHDGVAKHFRLSSDQQIHLFGGIDDRGDVENELAEDCRIRRHARIPDEHRRSAVRAIGRVRHNEAGRIVVQLRCAAGVRRRGYKLVVVKGDVPVDGPHIHRWIRLLARILEEDRVHHAVTVGVRSAERHDPVAVGIGLEREERAEAAVKILPGRTAIFANAVAVGWRDFSRHHSQGEGRKYLANRERSRMRICIQARIARRGIRVRRAIERGLCCDIGARRKRQGNRLRRWHERSRHRFRRVRRDAATGCAGASLQPSTKGGRLRRGCGQIDDRAGGIIRRARSTDYAGRIHAIDGAEVVRDAARPSPNQRYVQGESDH